MSRDRKPERVPEGETLGGIMNWEILFAVCRCEHYGELNLRHLKNKWGTLSVLRDLEPKLKCQKCEKMGSSAFFVMKMPR